jgi:hypothetical protein
MNQKEAVLALLAAGEITTSEAAWAIGQSRQTVHNWARMANLDPIGARAKRVRMLVAALNAAIQGAKQ